MRLLTLTQPFASLMALGYKRNETRGFGTAYRGDLAVRAGMNFPSAYRDLCATEPFRSALAGHYEGADPDLLPRGLVLCVVELYDIRMTDGMDCNPSPTERAFGDYSPGRRAWYTRNLRVVTNPVPGFGAQGLREWDPPHLDLVAKAA